MPAEQAFIDWYLSAFNYTTPAPVSKGAGTPYYRFWEIGVNVPVINNNFTYPKKIRENINAVSAGASTIVIAKGSSANATILANTLASLGFAKIQSLDGTEAETIELSSVSVSSLNVNITIYGTLINSYSLNAVFLYFSSKLADNWTIGDSAIIPGGFTKTYPIDYTDVDGRPRCQQFTIPLVSLTTNKKYIINALDQSIFKYLSSAYKYRIGARYYFSMRLNNSETNLIYTDFQATAPVIGIESNVYTSAPMINLAYWFDNSNIDNSNLKGKNYVFNQALNNSLQSGATLRDNARTLSLALSASQVVGINNTVTLEIEELYWEHSGGVENTLGCVLLPNAPQLDSLDIGWIDDGIQTLRVANNRGYNVFTYGSPNVIRKYNLLCTFQDVPIAIYNKLRILESFQNDGYTINIHPHLNELPQVLTGNLIIKRQKHNVPNLSRITFDIEFTEL